MGGVLQPVVATWRDPDVVTLYVQLTYSKAAMDQQSVLSMAVGPIVARIRGFSGMGGLVVDVSFEDPVTPAGAAAAMYRALEGAADQLYFLPSEFVA